MSPCWLTFPLAEAWGLFPYGLVGTLRCKHLFHSISDEILSLNLWGFLLHAHLHLSLQLWYWSLSKNVNRGFKLTLIWVYWAVSLSRRPVSSSPLWELVSVFLFPGIASFCVPLPTSTPSETLPVWNSAHNTRRLLFSPSSTGCIYVPAQQGRCERPRLCRLNLRLSHEGEVPHKFLLSQEESQRGNEHGYVSCCWAVCTEGHFNSRGGRNTRLGSRTNSFLHGKASTVSFTEED